MFIRRCQRSWKNLGIEILNGYKAENADIGADCIIVGNTISRGNAELEEVLNRKLLYRSQARNRQGRIYSRAAFVWSLPERTARRRRRASRPGLRKCGGLESFVSGRRHRAEFRREFSGHRQRLFRYRRRRIRHGLFR